MANDQLVQALKNAKKRNPSAYEVLSMVCGLPKKTIADIANGKREPTTVETMILIAQM